MNPRFQTKMTWFKVYGDDLLNDPDFMGLSDECQAMLAKCWCLASRKNGELPDVDGIAFALRKDKSFVIKTLSKLQGWLEGDCYHIASIEEEKEKEKEISIVHFDTFWNLYPKKVAREVCFKKWKSKKLDKIGEKIISHVKTMKETKQWKDSDGMFIPMPLTYINQERWDTEIEKKKSIWDGAK
jgi:hypothetical protein